MLTDEQIGDVYFNSCDRHLSPQDRRLAIARAVEAECSKEVESLRAQLAEAKAKLSEWVEWSNQQALDAAISAPQHPGANTEQK